MLSKNLKNDIITNIVFTTKNTKNIVGTAIKLIPGKINPIVPIIHITILAINQLFTNLLKSFVFPILIYNDNNMSQIAYKYIFGCFLFRLTLSIIVKFVNENSLKYLGYLSLLPAIGFTLIFITGVRNTGLGAFRNKIWWNYTRPIHSLLLFIFSYLAIRKNKNAYKVLLLDTILGLVFFLNNYR